MAASESFIPAARGLKRQRVAVLAAASPAQEKGEYVFDLLISSMPEWRF